MKKTTHITWVLLCLTVLLACDKENDDLVKPFSASEFPQVIVLSDEGDGDLEDEDKFSFKITLADRSDPEGKEPGGKVVPLTEDVTVQFAVKDFEGFDRLQDYILDAKAFYEIDDCTTSEDNGVNLNLQFNAATGVGSVTFPKGVEEIEIEFETDPDLFDDGAINTDDRSVTIGLTGMAGNANNVAINKSAEFTYKVFDDEGIYGEWELDVKDATAFAKFKELFGIVNEDIKDLKAEDVEEIIIEFEYEEVKAIVVLKELEAIDDCGDVSMENKVIEIEAEIEDIDDDAQDGVLEFGDDGFAYKGEFAITGKKLTLKLEGEAGNDTTDEITIVLEK